jgi:hypothetical protein
MKPSPEGVLCIFKIGCRQQRRSVSPPRKAFSTASARRRASLNPDVASAFAPTLAECVSLDTLCDVDQVFRGVQFLENGQVLTDHV